MPSRKRYKNGLWLQLWRHSHTVVNPQSIRITIVHMVSTSISDISHQIVRDKTQDGCVHLHTEGRVFWFPQLRRVSATGLRDGRGPPSGSTFVPRPGRIGGGVSEGVDMNHEPPESACCRRFLQIRFGFGNVAGVMSCVVGSVGDLS